MVPLIGFQTFCTGIQNCRTLLKMQYVIAIHLIRWLTNFYDFSFKSTATAAIGIHPTKAWLSQLVNFKNAIWTWGHFRRTICIKFCFKRRKHATETYGIFQAVFEPSCINRAWVLSSIKDTRKAASLCGMMRGVGGVSQCTRVDWPKG